MQIESSVDAKTVRVELAKFLSLAFPAVFAESMQASESAEGADWSEAEGEAGFLEFFESVFGRV